MLHVSTPIALHAAPPALPLPLTLPAPLAALGRLVLGASGTGGVGADVETGVQEGAHAATRAFGVEGGTAVAVGGAFVVGAVLAFLVFQLARLLLVRRERLRRHAAALSTPVALAVGFGAARVTLAVMAAGQDWYRGAAFVLQVALVAAAAWAVWRLVGVVEDAILQRYREAGVNDRRERKIRTQTMLLRRILNAVIVVVGVAVVLLAVPEVRALGTGLLASAGLISVIAGLAVQSTLTNVFAGAQLAFTDSIRVGDVVDMKGVFGTVEEITLSNVVVKLWDGRRMVYPSSHFTTQPFENWTRVGSAVSGVVELDVDWRVPMDALRARLTALLESTQLWDGEENSMQVTDAVGGMVRVRAVVSARTSGELWDLRCLVREDFVAFLRAEHPEGIYTQRVVPLEGASRDGVPLDGGPVGGVPVSGAPVPAGAESGSGREAAAAGEGGQAHDDAAAAAPGRHAHRHAHPRTVPQQIPAVPPPGGSGSHRVRSTQDASTDTVPLARAGDHASLYTGTVQAVRRNQELAGPGEDAFAERRAQRDAQLAADAARDEAGRRGTPAADPADQRAE